MFDKLVAILNALQMQDHDNSPEQIAKYICGMGRPHIECLRWNYKQGNTGNMGDSVVLACSILFG